MGVFCEEACEEACLVIFGVLCVEVSLDLQGVVAVAVVRCIFGDVPTEEVASRFLVRRANGEELDGFVVLEFGKV